MRPQTQSLYRAAFGIGWQLCAVFLNIISKLSRNSVSLYAYRPISQARHSLYKRSSKNRGMAISTIMLTAGEITSQYSTEKGLTGSIKFPSHTKK
jgi:hypothetical protein